MPGCHNEVSPSRLSKAADGGSNRRQAVILTAYDVDLQHSLRIGHKAALKRWHPLHICVHCNMHLCKGQLCSQPCTSAPHPGVLDASPFTYGHQLLSQKGCRALHLHKAGTHLGCVLGVAAKPALPGQRPRQANAHREHRCRQDGARSFHLAHPYMHIQQWTFRSWKGGRVTNGRGGWAASRQRRSVTAFGTKVIQMADADEHGIKLVVAAAQGACTF